MRLTCRKLPRRRTRSGRGRKKVFGETYISGAHILSRAAKILPRIFGVRLSCREKSRDLSRNYNMSDRMLAYEERPRLRGRAKRSAVSNVPARIWGSVCVERFVTAAFDRTRNPPPALSPSAKQNTRLHEYAVNIALQPPAEDYPN